MRNKQIKKKLSYQEVEVTDDTDNEHDPLTKTDDVNKNKTFCEWISHKPFSKKPFLFFIVGIIATIGDAIFYLMDNDTAFIICGILAASIAFYGLKHFYTLLGLKQQVDTFSKLNIKFGRESNLLSKEVDRIEAANDNLRDTHNRLLISNERNRQNLDQFNQIQNNMGALGKESIAEITEVIQKAGAMEKKWREQLFEHERALLHTVFERVERQGSRFGMNKNEFEEFENQLPVEYRNRFDRMGTFHYMSGGDSLIQYDDFRVALDVFAEMATNNEDIEFEIQKSPRKQKPSRQRQRKQIKFRSMGTLQEDDENADDDSSFGFGDAKLKPPEQLSSLHEAGSIDLEDIQFSESDEEEEEEEDDAPVLYDRKIVVTKRTVCGSRFKEDLALIAFSSAGTGNSSDQDYASDNTPKTPGFMFGKRHFEVPEQADVKMSIYGKQEFASLLDENVNDQ